MENQYPVRCEIQYPESLSRLLIFIKWLLAIPHFIVLALLNSVFFIITLLAFFAILFTGKYPKSMFKFAAGYIQWQMRLAAYIMLLTDKYPPFGLE